MMPTNVYCYGRFNGNLSDNSNDLCLSTRYQNNISDEDHLTMPSESFLKPPSPLFLKRSSLIKYDDSELVPDGSFFSNEKSEEIFVFAPDKTNNTQALSFPKTSSISSLKFSSLTEQWPSSEYCQLNKSKPLIQSKFVEQRSPLSITISQNMEKIADNNVHQIVKISPQVDTSLSFSSDKAVLSSCLSKCDSVSKFAATDIMKLMDFTDMSLVESLQNFIRKIPVIGESQERDRILTYFTDRFMACNPSAFKNNDACHTLVCAVMLLNTDIHGQVSKKRMTCKEFVDNILTNYPDNGYIEHDLINIYNFIRKTELKNEENSDNTNTLRHKFSKLLTKSLKSSPEINTVNIDPNLLNQQQFISGNIMRKCIKKSFGKKPALGHRGWKLQFASLIGLQLLLFKTNLNKTDTTSDQNDFNGDRISLTDSNISSELLRNDDSSLCLSINNPTKSIISKLPSTCSRENVQVSTDDVECCIKIHHAFADVVEKLKHKNVFSLRLADQAEYFFKVENGQLHAWINNINYAAAILSAPPIVGAGQCGLYKPLLPGYLTDLDKGKQIQSHEDQIRHYRESLKKLQLVNSKARSLNEAQIRFCKYEITRFDAYIRLLRCQPIDECRSDQLLRRSDMNSIVSTIDLQPPQSPWSAVVTSHHHHNPDDIIQDMSTLRRRPHHVPNSSFPNSNISRTASSPSHKIQILSPIQMSPTADSLHSYVLQSVPAPRHIPSSIKPMMTYSPQIGSHLQCLHSPVPSFSRFIEPSYSPSFRQSPQPPIFSPLTTVRSRNYHATQSQLTPVAPVAPVPINKLPKYSPPSSRHNFSKI